MPLPRLPGSPAPTRNLRRPYRPRRKGPMPDHEPKPLAAPLASNTAKGIAWMLLTGILFVGVTGTVRHLGSDMSAYQASFLRYVFGLLIMAPVLWRIVKRTRGRLRAPRQAHLHLLRGLVHGTGVMLWFYAMARIPIAEVTALGYTAPIWTTIMAVIFLRERIAARRIAAVVIGFVGVMIILRPGLQDVSFGQLAQVLAAPLFAVSFICAKKLTEHFTNGEIVASLSILVTLTLLPPALFHWRTPHPDELFWLFITASLATAGHWTLAQAFRHTEITVTQPVSFLQLVWATLLGYLAFGEEPDVWTWAGAGVIVVSATYIAHREVRARRLADSTPKTSP